MAHQILARYHLDKLKVMAVILSLGLNRKELALVGMLVLPLNSNTTKRILWKVGIHFLQFFLFDGQTLCKDDHSFLMRF